MKYNIKYNITRGISQKKRKKIMKNENNMKSKCFIRYIEYCM